VSSSPRPFAPQLAAPVPEPAREPISAVPEAVTQTAQPNAEVGNRDSEARNEIPEASGENRKTGNQSPEDGNQNGKTGILISEDRNEKGEAGIFVPEDRSQNGEDRKLVSVSGGSGAGLPETLRVLFDAAPIAVALRRENVVLYVNPAFVELLGAREESEIVGRSPFDFLAPDEVPGMIERRQARDKEGFHSQPTNYEARARRLDGALVPMRVEVAPIALPDGAAIIIYAFDLSPELADRRAIEALLEKERRAARFATQLQELSAALSTAFSPNDVAATSLETCKEAAGALGAVFIVPEQGENGVKALLLLQSRGYSADVLAGWERMQLDDITPIAQAFRTGEAVWVHDTEAPDCYERFPVLRGNGAAWGTGALVALPLRLDGRVLGVMGLNFKETHAFDDEERTFLLTLAGTCAQALQRTNLDRESRALARRQRESLALLNTLLDSAPVGFALFDRDHCFVLANRELSRMSGRPIEAHFGQSAGDVFPTLGSVADDLLEEVWNCGQPSETISFAFGTGGERHDARHCSLAFYPVRLSDENSEVLGVGAVWIETSERERNDRERERLFGELEIERARFEAILQQMPSAVIIGEAPSGRLILGNARVEEVLGRPYLESQSVDEYSAYPVFHSDGRPLSPQEYPLSRALQGGQVVRGEELSIQRDDGTLGVIRINAAPIRDRDGSIVAGVAIFDNVTKRARAAAAQRFLAEAGAILVAALDEKQSFQALANLCVPRVADWCIIALVASDGSLQSAGLAHGDASQNDLADRLRELLQRDPRLPFDVMNAIGNERAALYGPADLQKLRLRDAGDEYTPLLREIGVQSGIVAPLAARGRTLGAMFWLNARSHRPFDDTDLTLAEEVARRAALSCDNTRLLQEAQSARDAAQLARDEAQAANRAKDEFLAVVSHELRTPLTPILGWLELLRSPGADDALRKQAYDVIERNAGAQAQLVNDILDMSRITTGKLRLELRDVTLDELVARSVENLRTMWLDKGLRVELDLQSGLHARADAGRLGQVVTNLLQNAIKFTPSGGEVHVSLHRLTPDENNPAQSLPFNIGNSVLNGNSPALGNAKSANEAPRARLEVRDSGVGIAPELVPRVFDRFQQGDSSSTRKAGGLGLGLAIVKHIVQLHGGRVDVRSDGRGLGATFGVELPLSPAPSIVAPPDNIAVTPASVSADALKGARVLVVDDEPFTREMLARLLEDAGAVVRSAASGQIALEIVPQFGPSALVCDIGMPDMDGLELRRELLARNQTAPAVALTAYASPTDETRAREAGFNAYLAKPIGALALVETLARLLGRV